MELEHGKDFKTYFFDNNVVCFYSRKLYWKTVEMWQIANKKDWRGNGEYFVNDEESIMETYANKISTQKCQYDSNGYFVTDPKFELISFSEKEQKAILNSRKRTEVKVEFYKKAVCCPACHKVHRLENYIQVKPEKKHVVEQVCQDYGEDWLTLFGYEHYLNPNAYFESVFEDYDGGNLSDHLEQYPEQKKYKEHHQMYYYKDGVRKIFYPKIVCPSCGCLVNEYNLTELSIFNKFSDTNSYLKAITIFNDQKKVAVSALFRCYYINVDALTIARDEYRIRLTFNTESGQTYFVGPKKLNGRKMSGWHDYYLMNITYRHPNYPLYPARIFFKNTLVKKEIFKLLMERNKDTIDKFKNFPLYQAAEEYEDFCVPTEVRTLEDVDFEQVPLSWVTLYNRFPCLNGEQLENLFPEEYIDSYYNNYFMKDLFKGVKRNSSAQELLESVMKNCKVPTSKKLKKIVARNLLIAKNLMAFVKCGFKDINIICRFCDLPIEQTDCFANNIDMRDFKEIKIFIKDMIKRKGESRTFNTLFNDNPCCSYITDSARMYVKFKEVDMVLNEYFTDSIKKIHDRMSKDYSKIRFKNVKINYPAKSDKYNMVVSNEYEFNLAEDTNELVKIGQELRICVGGYRDHALSGGCRIISMKQNGKYVGCIELSSDFKRLVQAKAMCNNKLQEFKAQALKEWVETLCIDASNCYDYAHIKDNEIKYESDSIYQSSHDYHHFELDEEGNVITAAQRNNNPIDNDDDFPFG